MTDKPKVAIIDDEVRVLRALKMQLKHRYEVFACTEPNELIDLVEHQRIHVVLSDQRMPLMSGVELLSQVKLHSPSTSRILLTGYSDLSAIMASINLSEIHRYMIKPWHHDELNEVVAKAVRLSMSFDDHDPHAHDLPEAATILLMSDDAQVKRLVKNQLASTCQFVSMKPDQCHAVDAQKFSIAMFDLDSDPDPMPIIEQINQCSHHTVMIVLTASVDAKRLIRLVNDGQIYRCLPKPLSASVLQANIKQALRRYRYLLNKPKLNFN